MKWWRDDDCGASGPWSFVFLLVCSGIIGGCIGTVAALAAHGVLRLVLEIAR